MSGESVATAIGTDTLVGTLIHDKYRVMAVVAAGGMGKIYRAEQLPLGRDVALKVMLPRSDTALDGRAERVNRPASASRGTASFQKRFFLEASILSKLQHPNVATIFDYGAIETPGGGERLFMVMEYLDGETLEQRLRATGTLTVTATLHVATQIALALAETHAHGVVHRDLKPPNLMLVTGRDRETRVKVVDFGIGKVMAAGPTHEEITHEGVFLGSPSYIAPEQIGDTNVDHRTDIYSFGVIVYECLTGMLPYDAAGATGLLVAHLHAAPVPMKARAPEIDVPEWLEAVVMRCLEKDPNNRPATMGEVVRLLERRGEEGDASPESMPRTRSDFPISGAVVALPPGPLSGRSLRAPSLPAIDAISTAPDGAAPGPQRDAGSAEPPMRTRASDPTVQDTRAAAVVALALAVVIGAAFTMRSGRPALTAPAEAGALAAAGAAVAAEPLAATGRAFSLVIESHPPGAIVIERGERLGTTPVHLTLAADGGRGDPSTRTYSIELPGYLPYTFEEGPSDANVRVIATLVAATAASAVPPARPPPRAAGPPPRRAGAPATAARNAAPRPASTLEIRLDR